MNKISRDYGIIVESMGTKRSFVLRRNLTKNEHNILAIEAMVKPNIIVMLITLEKKMTASIIQSNIMNVVTRRTNTKRNVSTVEK